MTSNPNYIDPESIREWDRQYVWRPFTQMKLWVKREPILIVAGEKEFLIDSEGRKYIDGNSSMWCNIHGHGHPAINDALIDQIGRICHSTMLGLSSPPSVALAKRLVEIAPPNLAKVFFSDDGSTAMEVACKMAFAYWRHRGQPDRESFVSLRNAYHGDTVGAVSVGGIDEFHRIYRPMLFETLFAPSPYCYRCELGLEFPECQLACADAVGDLLKKHKGQVVAVCAEPLMQSAGGMIAAPPGHLERVRRICDDHDVLLILDEVATGFGRTGRMFACEHEDVRPDILCLSKGLTNGALPLAATLTSQDIYDAFLGEIHEGRTFYHGHTYTGNQLGCRAALASLDVFEAEETLARLEGKVKLFADELDRLRSNRWVGDVRRWGLMAGVEIVADKPTRKSFPYSHQVGAQICQRAAHYGVILRPVGDVIVIMPPLSIGDDSLRQLLNALERSIVDVLENPANDSSNLIDGLE
jgi:adenosylmethionine-8-amino-7-oxononanoate aminotransferase